MSILRQAALGLALIALSVCAGETSPDAGLELRAACFEWITVRLNTGPIKDVPWSQGQKLTITRIDKERQILTTSSGGLELDLQWKKVSNDELARLLAAAAGEELTRNHKPVVLLAALHASSGKTEAAKLQLDKLQSDNAAAEEGYKLWLAKLGLDKPVAPVAAPPAAGASANGNGATASENSTATRPVKQESGATEPPSSRKAIAKEHPRLFGSRSRLQALANERSEAYKQMAKVARNPAEGDWCRMPAMALVCAVEGDAPLGKEAVKLAMKYATGPIRVGHETFGHDLALCAFVYDHCHPHWTPEERAKFIEYFNKTADANLDTENVPFGNPYYGYKNWGIGLAAYATMYENPRAQEHLARLETDLRTRVSACLNMVGDGGGWAEGWYAHSWFYEWLVFCESARLCEGIDYYALAPKFFRHRAIGSMFEMLPGDGAGPMNAPVPNGDGTYGDWGGYSEKILAARRILSAYYRNDPAHQAVNTFNAAVKHCIMDNYAYMDFLWNDPTVPKRDLKTFKLSHFTPGSGHVYARSSWEPDSTYLFFKCTKRYTGHQHLDAGHFMIFKHAPLATDGGRYDNWVSDHSCNYYVRTIAHSTMLIYDPSEKMPEVLRNWERPENDGGQAYPWLSINRAGNFADCEEVKKNWKLHDIADILAYDDQHAFLYTAGDATRAYASTKLECFTRQIVYLRPNTFVIFDRVKSKHPNFKKTWQLQAAQKPEGSAPNFTITNGKGRLFLQTLLPAKAVIKLNTGNDMYTYNGKSHPPSAHEPGMAMCRMEISPSEPALADYFLNVLTAADASTASVPQASVKVGSDIVVTVGEAVITFKTAEVGGSISLGGRSTPLSNNVPRSAP